VQGAITIRTSSVGNVTAHLQEAPPSINMADPLDGVTGEDLGIDHPGKQIAQGQTPAARGGVLVGLELPGWLVASNAVGPLLSSLTHTLDGRGQFGRPFIKGTVLNAPGPPPALGVHVPLQS
jgi:hypothetical protein